MMTSDSASTVKTGQRIILVGLYIQLIFFGLFIINGFIFMIRLRKNPNTISARVPWMKHLITLFLVSSLILIRSIYRVVEYVQGRDGNLMSHEIYLYALDSALMFLVMLIFGIMHPSEVQALHRGGKVAKFVSVREVAKEDYARMSNVSLLPIDNGMGGGRPMR